jgi:hypothetical protein
MGAVAEAKVRLLVDRGADVISRRAAGARRSLPPWAGTSAPVVRYLLEHGANIAADNGNVTTLLGATLGNDTGSIRLLIDAGVDVNLVTGDTVGDFSGGTPLMMAAAAGNGRRFGFCSPRARRSTSSRTAQREGEKRHHRAPEPLRPRRHATATYGRTLIKDLVAAGAGDNVKDARHDARNARGVGRPWRPGGGEDVARCRRRSTRSLAGETAMDWAASQPRRLRDHAKAVRAPVSGCRRATVCRDRAREIGACGRRGFNFNNNRPLTGSSPAAAARCHARTTSPTLRSVKRARGLP